MTVGEQSRIRVVLRGYDSRVIEQSARQIIDTAIRTGAKIAGPVPMPTRIKKFCVTRSPHVDKRSMEHFEMRIYKRLIDILDPTNRTIDSLTHLELPAGVDIEIK